MVYSDTVSVVVSQKVPLDGGVVQTGLLMVQGQSVIVRVSLAVAVYVLVP